MTGLVAKSRREKQNATAGLYAHQREELKQKFFGSSGGKKECKCGNYTAGLYKDGKLICPICKQTL